MAAMYGVRCECCFGLKARTIPGWDMAGDPWCREALYVVWSLTLWQGCRVNDYALGKLQNMWVVRLWWKFFCITSPVPDECLSTEAFSARSGLCL